MMMMTIMMMVMMRMMMTMMMMMMMMMMMTIIKVLRMMGIETSGEEADQLFATVDTNRLDCDPHG